MNYFYLMRYRNSLLKDMYIVYSKMQRMRFKLFKNDNLKKSDTFFTINKFYIQLDLLLKVNIY